MSCARHAVRGVIPGSFEPQFPQFDHVSSTGFPHCGHIGFRDVPQFGQNVYFDRTFDLHEGQVTGGGSRRMKYRIMPIPSGMKIASSVHITWRMPRRLASPDT